MSAPSTHPVAVLDANVIYPQFLRDVLLRLAAANLFIPRWTDRIRREWSRNLAADRPDIPAERIERLHTLMEQAFPDARVTGYRTFEPLFPTVHPKDRHVAAAALRGGATVIVTRNLRDFPRTGLAAHGLNAIDPDEFIAGLIAGNRVTAVAVLEGHRAGLMKPPHTAAEYRAALIAAGLPRSARRLIG